MAKRSHPHGAQLLILTPHAATRFQGRCVHLDASPHTANFGFGIAKKIYPQKSVLENIKIVLFLLLKERILNLIDLRHFQKFFNI